MCVMLLLLRVAVVAVGVEALWIAKSGAFCFNLKGPFFS